MLPSILVVDDHLPTLHLIDRLLTMAGYTVRTAADGEEALTAIATERPALVLTDLQMPRVPGHTLIAHLQRHHPQVRIVVTTALGSGAAVPGLPFLAKPFSQDQLLARVRGALPSATDHRRP